MNEGEPTESPAPEEQRKKWGAWAGEETEEERLKKLGVDDLEKRKTLRNLIGIAAGVTGAHLSKVALEQKTPENQEVLSTIEPTVVIDYFGDKTDEETRSRLLEHRGTSLEELKNVEFNNFEEWDDIMRAIEGAKTLGDNEILARLLLEEAIKTVGSHGNFVEEEHKNHLNRLTSGGDQTPIQKVGLQNAIENYTVETDMLGNPIARLTIQKNLVQELTKDLSKDSVTVNAYQFGEVELKYQHTRIIEPKIGDLDYNGKLYFFQYPNTEAGTSLAAQVNKDKSGNAYVDINGQQVEAILFEGDIYDNSEVEIAITQFKTDTLQDIEDKIASGNLTKSELGEYTEEVPLDSRITYVEPYNKQENVDEYQQYCNDNPEMAVVMAAGNNTDMRGLDIQSPDNGILVSGMGGNGRARAAMFDTDSSRNIGGIGADIYVLYNQFHDDTEIGVMSSSEATAIVGAYAQKLKELGLNANKIKQVLLDECTDTSNAGDEFPVLNTGSGDFVSGNVFNKEKADAYVAQEQNKKRPGNLI